MNKIFATISSLLIAMGIKGQVPVKKETSSIPITHADTISPKKVYSKVESKMVTESKVESKIDHKGTQVKVITGKEHKDSPNGTAIPKVEHKLDHKIAQTEVIHKVEHKVSSDVKVIPKVEHKISNQ